MRGICTATLTMQSIVLALSTPVLIKIADLDVWLGCTIGLGLALVCLIAAGSLRHPWGYWLGHLVQVGALASGVFSTAILVIAVIFAALWIAAFMIGRKMEADKARWATEG